MIIFYIELGQEQDFFRKKKQPTFFWEYVEKKPLKAQECLPKELYKHQTIVIYNKNKYDLRNLEYVFTKTK